MEEYASLVEIAQKIKDSNKKVTLLYAFNNRSNEAVKL